MSDLARVFDELADRYDEMYSDPASRNEDLDFVPRLVAALPRDRELRVLDVGCGTGWLLDKLGDRFDQYCGFDLSHGMIGRLREKHSRGDVEAWAWDMNETPWIGGRRKFSLVTSLWCSASYVSPEVFFAQAARSLEERGVVVAMPHAKGSEAEGRVTQWHDYLPLEVYGPASGWRPWTADAARTAAEEAGFVDVRVEGFQSGVPHLPSWTPTWAHRLARWAQPKPEQPDDHTFLVITGRKP